MTAAAREPERTHTGQELAERTRVPLPTVAKLLKALTRAPLLESLRCAHGGYRLASSAAKISVADIIGALEGPIAVTACSEPGTDLARQTFLSGKNVSFR